MDVAFFCVSSTTHFLGAVSLLNSLRKVGHDEPFYLTDYGLNSRQRELISDHVEFIPAPRRDISPLMLKTHGPLEVNPEIAIILDADIVMLKPFTELIGPKPAIFLNDWTWRFEPEWERLGYKSLHRIPYLNSGQMIFPRSSGLVPMLKAGNERLLEIMRAEPEKFRLPSSPFYYTDQDVVNALFSSLSPDDYVVSDKIGYYPFEAPLDDAILLHHILAKPWLTPLRPNPFSRAMIELLQAGPVKLPMNEIPPRLRPGAIGSVARARCSVQHTLREHTRGKLGIRRRLAERQAARESSSTQ